MRVPLVIIHLGVPAWLWKPPFEDDDLWQFLWVAVLIGNIYENIFDEEGTWRWQGELSLDHMGVSWNRGYPKWKVYKGTFYYNGWFGGTPILGDHTMDIWWSRGNISHSRSMQEFGNDWENQHDKSGATRQSGRWWSTRGIWDRRVNAVSLTFHPPLNFGCFAAPSWNHRLRSTKLYPVEQGKVKMRQAVFNLHPSIRLPSLQVGKYLVFGHGCDFEVISFGGFATPSTIPGSY